METLTYMISTVVLVDTGSPTYGLIRIPPVARGNILLWGVPAVDYLHRFGTGSIRSMCYHVNELVIFADS